MSKKGSRGPGQQGPPGRRGRGGSGPVGPYRTGGGNTGGGSKHTTGGCMLAKAVGAVILGFIAASTAATFLSLVAG